MRVLVACEESQIVCKAFRYRGHEAYSCDILPCSGGHPEWHIQRDALLVAYSGEWDLMIGHPPCRYLTTTANRSHKMFPEREEERVKAIDFFTKLFNAPIPKIALENPKGVLSSRFQKPDQYIQPFHHGHTDSKLTGLWLKNLPALYPTNKVEPVYITSKSGKRHSVTHWKNPGNSTVRSKTYTGIAKAMAEQWG